MGIQADRATFMENVDAGRAYFQTEAFMGPVIAHREDDHWRVSFGMRPKGRGYAILGAPMGGEIAGFLTIGSFVSCAGCLAFVRKLANICTQRDGVVLALEDDFDKVPTILEIEAESPAEPNSAAIMAMSLAFEMEVTARAYRDDCLQRVKRIAVRRDVAERDFYDSIYDAVLCADDSQSGDGALRPALPMDEEDLPPEAVDEPFKKVDADPKAFGTADIPKREEDVMSGYARAASVRIKPEIVATRTQGAKSRSGGRLLALIPSVDRERLVNAHLKKAIAEMIHEKIDKEPAT